MDGGMEGFYKLFTIIIIIIFDISVLLVASELKPDFSEVFNSAENCHVHIIEYSEPLEYSKINVPFILTKLGSNGTMYFWAVSNFSKHIKIRYMDCSIESILLPGKDTYNGSLYSHLTEVHGKYRYSKAAVTGQTQPTFIENFLFFLITENDFTELAATAADYYSIYSHHRFENKANKTVIIFLLFQQNYAGTKILEGRIRRSGCKISNALFAFNLKSTPDSNLFHNIKEAYAASTDDGRELCWRVRDGTGIKNTLNSPNFGSPFSRENYQNIKLASYNFLLTALNTTMLISNPSGSHEIPEIISLPGGFWVSTLKYSYEYYLSGYGEGIVFVTADGVFKEEKSMSLLFGPLDSSVWYCTLGLSVLAIILMTGLLWKFEYLSLSFKDAAGSSAWSVLSMFLEKPHSLFKKGNSDTLKITVGLVFMAAVVISNAYKGMVKSNFVVKNPYQTKWEELQDLINFNFFSVMDDDNYCNTVVSDQILSMRYLFEISDPNDTTIIATRHKPFLDCILGRTQGSLKCSLLRQAWVALSQKRDPLSREFVDAFFNNHSLFCLRTLSKAIRAELIKAKTAFVMTSNQFTFYWNYFQKEMDQNPKYAFAHNKNVKDMFLRIPQAFVLSMGWNSMYQRVPKRALNLLSSGIYWFWEKWELLRFHRTKYIQEGIGQEMSAVFRELSMIHPNVRYIFYVLCLGILLSSVAFVSEVILYYLP
ncbi:unnamed protein product [Allacma fusca]|uniref:Uncharacterized protein n=1 Tax=Allacma fusca TaxID=39272 RepID=A0A8J2PUR2_9HEXA|nr:unnamed protein product [Allacma fusca]